MIRKKEITTIAYGERAIIFLAKGTNTVWQSIKSCFGSGWRNDKSWNNDENW